MEAKKILEIIFILAIFNNISGVKSQAGLHFIIALYFFALRLVNS